MSWIVDSHCHLDDPAYDEIREDVLEALPVEGVLALVNPGVNEENSQAVLDLARQSDRVFACMGTHPQEADSYSHSAEYIYRTLALDPKLVAMGEIGLDYHYMTSSPRRQKDVLTRQLDLAQDLDLPVVIHCRDAVEDLVPILLDKAQGLKVLMHCFNEPVEAWQDLAPLDPYISIGGMVTFKNAPYPKALAQVVSPDRLLIETDGPYLAPVPKRGQVNKPWYARYSLETVAEIRGDDPDWLAGQVLKNTETFYGLEDEFKVLLEKLGQPGLPDQESPGQESGHVKS